jgi:hypothetical protein
LKGTFGFVTLQDKMFKLVRDLLGLIIAVVEILLTLRFVLKLLAANQVAPVVNWIYETSQPLLQPFLFAFPAPAIKGGFILEFTTLFALFAYAFIGYILEQILEIIDNRK